ncbi:ATP-binding cassette domain-containing protein, partial [Noviherbaspirillum sp.]|uniref:ATP-binding cassette domain-containing protein n=1 Tax=Noviherbaspirillum sp. TaxID=1926288 RepID=UPI002FE28BAC
MSFRLEGVAVRHHATAAAPVALSDMTLSIAAGEHVALVGPSGAGKTTLLHTLACAHRPHGG